MNVPEITEEQFNVIIGKLVANGEWDALKLIAQFGAGKAAINNEINTVA